MNKRYFGILERFINLIASVIAIGLVGASAASAASDGHWDWRVAFYALLTVTLVCTGLMYYAYSSRVAVRMFSGNSKIDRMCEADLYVAKRIKEARKSVWDFAWQDDAPPQNSTAVTPTDGRNAGTEALDAAIRSVIVAGSVPYYEILTTRSYARLLKKHLGYCEDIAEDKKLKYHARIYDNTRNGYKVFPKIQLVIIDEEEVIFISSGYEYCFGLKSNKTAAAFLKYAHMAWDQADEWKPGMKDVIVNGEVVTDFGEFLRRLVPDALGRNMAPNSLPGTLTPDMSQTRPLTHEGD